MKLRCCYNDCEEPAAVSITYRTAATSTRKIKVGFCRACAPMAWRELQPVFKKNGSTIVELNKAARSIFEPS